MWSSHLTTGAETTAVSLPGPAPHWTHCWTRSWPLSPLRPAPAHPGHRHHGANPAIMLFSAVVIQVEILCIRFSMSHMSPSLWSGCLWRLALKNIDSTPSVIISSMMLHVSLVVMIVMVTHCYSSITTLSNTASYHCAASTDPTFSLSCSDFLWSCFQWPSILIVKDRKLRISLIRRPAEAEALSRYNVKR